MVSHGAAGLAFGRVAVIGRGRVGAAVAGRLVERGIEVLDSRGSPGCDDLVLLCVPDAAIVDAARACSDRSHGRSGPHDLEGPWMAHVSGATPLAALGGPAGRCFSVHPLQTFTRARGAEQLDGAWAAVTAGSAEARGRGYWLAECLGLRPFELADDRRTAYHAGAVIASNFLVGLHRAAVRLFREAGAPPEALVPLMRRTIENGFDLTGPVARGDWAVVDAHLAEIRATAPELEGMYRALAAVIAP